MKAELLKQVDSFLFAECIKTLSAIYQTAVKTQGGDFSYNFFHSSLGKPNAPRNYAVPSAEVITYLQPHVDMYTPMIRRRELIQCYLLQFMNQSEDEWDVLHLLPFEIISDLNLTEMLPEIKATKPLVEIFKAQPGYDLIKQQLVFKTMGI